MQNINKVLKREEIDEKYKWNLKLIYENNDLWEEDICTIKGMAEKIIKFKGTLSLSSKNLLECLKLRDEMLALCDKVCDYAIFKKDEDNTNYNNLELFDRANSLQTEVDAAVSFIISEVLSISEKTLGDFFEDNQELLLFRKHIEDKTRMRQHILSSREEEIISLSNSFSKTPRQIFNAFNNADIKFPEIKGDDGENIKITKGNFDKLLETNNSKTRENIFKSFYGAYISYKNTLGNIFNANIKKEIFYSKARTYNSALEASLDKDNINHIVYDNLINIVDENLNIFHRYISLRKKVLGVSELHMYDLFVPLVNESKSEIKFDEALDIIKQGIAPLGKDYIGDLEKLLSLRIIDVFESKGKTAGGYAAGSYLTKPYILLNYQGSMRDLFCTAHEIGHTMHRYYSNGAQPFVYAYYSKFVAEVASQVNEAILANYLINKAKDRKEKAYLIYSYLEQFKLYLFRQTMLAKFEKIVYEKSEKGEALTSSYLCEIYHDLNVKHFGEAIIVDGEIDIEWARMPHFYNPFYVYKYVTGFSAATSISKALLNGDTDYKEKYLEFLSSGCSEYPLELLKKVGVDLTTSKPIEDTLKVFEDLIDELESLLD